MNSRIKYLLTLSVMLIAPLHVSAMEPKQKVLFQKIFYSTECPVCLDALTADDTVVTPCRHLFHQHCIEDVLARYNRCPSCQNDFSDQPPQAMNEKQLHVVQQPVILQQPVIQQQQVIQVQHVHQQIMPEQVQQVIQPAQQVQQDGVSQGRPQSVTLQELQQLQPLIEQARLRAQRAQSSQEIQRRYLQQQQQEVKSIG